MIDKYVGLEQYKRSIDSIKEYVDKSIPHFGEPEVIFTLPADKVLEIYNSDAKAMEFDKPSNINLDYNFIVSYNNEDITDISIMDNGDFKIIFLNNNNIVIGFVPGVDINQNINENKMVVVIEGLNIDITPTDVILKQMEAKYLNNKYLKNDVAIKNSITIGSRLKRKGYGIGQYSFSNGEHNISSGYSSHAEGAITRASGDSSHAEGINSTASEEASHAEGINSTASGYSSHAEGINSTASGDSSHAEGYNTIASGNNSHAEGRNTTASENRAHAEGYDTIASGANSHAEGRNTRASGDDSHVQGKYNIEDTENKYAHIIGNGTSDTTRTNAHTVDWEGNAWYQGKLSQDGSPTEDKDLTTKKYVDDKVSGLVDSAPDALNTLNELAAALGDDANFATTVTNTLAGKVDKVDGKTLSTNDLTNELKANYDAAYTHSQSAHFDGDYNSLTNEPCNISIGEIINVATSTDIQTVIDDSKHVLVLNKIFGLEESDEYLIECNNEQSISSVKKNDNNILYLSITDSIFIYDNATATSITDVTSNEGTSVIIFYKYSTGFDLNMYKINRKYINNYFLPNDLKIYNSLSLGRKFDSEIGVYSVAIGSDTEASGKCSYAEGFFTIASGEDSHAEGSKTQAIGNCSHSEGYNTNAFGSTSHVEGYLSKTISKKSNDEYQVEYTLAAHAEGNNTRAAGLGSHSEGSKTQAIGNYSHSENCDTRALGDSSHAEGRNTIASGDNSHVQGKYNIEDTENKYAHIVGNGNRSLRSNAHTLDWNGNGWYQGNIFVGGTGQDDANKLATENYVNNRFLNVDIASTLWIQNTDTGLYELTYTHNLASENITVQVYNTDSKYEMFVDTQIVDSNSIKITSDENPNCAIRIVKF